MDNHIHFRSYHLLREAATELYMSGHDSVSAYSRKANAEAARGHIMQAIGRTHSHEEARELALDLIEAGYDDANDIDVTSRDFANAILDRILDAICPIPGKAAK